MRPWYCGASANSRLARASLLVAGASDVDAGYDYRNVTSTQVEL